MLDDLAKLPALWGFIGALVYAGYVLSNALWGGDEPLRPRARYKAIAEFTISIIFGPAAAESFGPSIASFGWLADLDARAVYMTIGLSANYVWPMAVKALGGVVVGRIERGG